jgi:hypothetical protein
MGAPMEVLKRLCVLIVFLCSVVSVVNTAEARLPEIWTSGPEELINSNPCIGIVTVDYDDAPDQLFCVGSAKLEGLLAAINIPVPMIADKEPELSLVGIPTYFSLTWDAPSFGYTDSDSTIYEWVENNNERNRLVGVRVQLRIIPYRVNEVLGNVEIFSQNSQIFVKAEGGMEETRFSDEVCNPGWKLGLNSLLMIPEQWGGWAGDEGIIYDTVIIDRAVCMDIKKELEGGSFINVPSFSIDEHGDEVINPLPIAGRYPYWKSSSLVGYPRVFGAISESASISGEGIANGSPAYQIDARTYVQVEARVIWDKHEIYRRYKTGRLRCEWEYYYTGYDVVDMSRWPDPIYCRYVYGWDWFTECEGLGCDANGSLGNPDTWWEKVLFPGQRNYYLGDTVYFTDGFEYRHADAIRLVVIQAQPLLIVP